MPGPALSVRLRRWWRLFRTEQPRGLQLLTPVIAALVIANLIALGTTGSSSGKSAAAGRQRVQAGAGLQGPAAAASDTSTTGTGVNGPTGGANAGTGGSNSGSVSPVGPGAGTPTSSANGALVALGHGVTASSVRVVFPYPNLGPLGQAVGLYGSSEDDQLSIMAAVDAINAAGGINGRTIDPEIVGFNPLDEASMRADCIQWTQDQHVFAVVDADAWHDDSQLCITQENHTPLISSWTTVTDWTTRGNPYLWWTGPDTAEVLSNLVAWAGGTGQLTPSTKFGVVAADRSADTLAVGALNRDLSAAKLAPAASGSMHFDLADSAQSIVQAQDIVSQFRSKGVTTVIPLLPYNDFVFFVQAAQQQGWVPHWLLSDYEFEDQAALGLIDPASGGPYAKELNNAVNPTFFDLGNCDCDKPLPQGYDSFGAQCNANFNKYSGAAWRKMQQQQGNTWSGFIETTGTAMTWCTNINLFAAAARAVIPNHLTQDAFTHAMAGISHFAGQLAPDYEYGGSRRAGPHEFRVVQEHVNSDGKCPLKVDGGSQGDCWLIQQDFRPELSVS